MKVEQGRWTDAIGWNPPAFGTFGESADLVLLFGVNPILNDPEILDTIRRMYPRAHFLGCSTAGEIYETSVMDDSLVVTAVSFDSTKLKLASIELSDASSSLDAGERLAEKLVPEGLVHVFVLSDGLQVNGSDLVTGLTNKLPDNVTVTGGLSGDAGRFEKTYVLCDDIPEQGKIAVVGFYGNDLKVGYASLGGWDSFGPDRLITRSERNVLYELDGESALELYKSYLGDHASGLPATGLLFPLSVRRNEDEKGIVRTILAVDEETQSMTFAGDLPEGYYARLMKANFNRLVDGAAGAARSSYEEVGLASPDLAILISCVGRKMVLKQRIEEEVEAVREVLGEKTAMTGFYSYGEISPFTPSAKCELHNQTMTITTFSEK